jgi:hypothetical protein
MSPSIRSRRVTLALFGRVREEPSWTAERYGYSHVVLTWKDHTGAVVVRDHIPREDAIKLREQLDVAIRKAGGKTR